MTHFVPNPIAFTIFGLDIRWYGLLISLGILLGGYIFYKNAEKVNLDPGKILDYIIAGVPAGIVGARIYYVIFNWNYYLNQDGTINFLKIINIRLGGLAIHGTLIFAFLAVILVARYHKYNPLDVLDAAVPGVVLAQSIGRWGNFFNSEAHGTPTDLPWGIYVDGQMVHPTFLYESLWCFALFIFLIIFIKKRQFKGQILLLYAGLYSIERFLVEGLRTDSLMLGPLRQAQVLSLTVVILSVLFYVILKKRSSKTE